MTIVTSVMRDDLHRLLIPCHFTYKLCTLLYRRLHGTTPQYLSNYCMRLADQPLRTSRNRSAAAGNLFIPSTRLKTYGQRSFSTSGSTAWNSLPVELKTVQSFPLFKKNVKTHLFNCCYVCLCKALCGACMLQHYINA